MYAVDYWYSDFKFNWKKFFSKKRNMVSFIITLGYFFAVTYLFKCNLVDLEKIQGTQLTDIILNVLPRYDFSMIIFVLLYTVVFYNYFILFAYPKLLQIFIIFYATSLLFRLLTLFVFHLEPPIGIIVLFDPILSESTYNGIPITKDLFFSGHMVAVLCSYYTVPNKTLKFWFLIVTIIIAILLMFQHIHYTIDIIGAVLLVLLLYRIYFRKQWLNSKYSYQYSKELINVE